MTPRISLDSLGISKALRTIDERQAVAMTEAIEISRRARRMGMSCKRIAEVWHGRGVHRYLAAAIAEAV